MHTATRSDRLWFQRNPEAIVRFRRPARGEFDPLFDHGEQPPCFRPKFIHAEAPLCWVAVVDLLQILGEVPERNTPAARLRLLTPALRSAKYREEAKKELIEAVCAELLHITGMPLNTSNQSSTNDSQQPAQTQKAISA